MKAGEIGQVLYWFALFYASYCAQAEIDGYFKSIT